MKRINVVGTSGSGKTTFSKELAQKLNIEYIEMDRLYWKNDWRGSSDAELLHSIHFALKGEAWVLDGNYNRTQAVKWEHLDTLIWLDFPFYLVFYRVLKRAIKRAITKEKLWNTNNYENFKLLFSKDSIVLWMITSYPTMKKRYSEVFENPNVMPQVKMIRLKSPKQASVFLKEIKG